MGKSAVEAAGEDGNVTEPAFPVDETTPSFRDIHISNVVCAGAARAMYFNGLPEMPVKGIDISVWQGKVNWDTIKTQVKNGDLDFVIIRCGYGTNTTSKDDSKFARNVKACEDMPVREPGHSSHDTEDAGLRMTVFS